MLILLDIALAFHDIIIIIISRPAADASDAKEKSKKLQLNYSFGGSRVFTLQFIFLSEVHFEAFSRQFFL